MEEEGTGIVIDVKYAKNGNFEQGCREAMEQIEKMGYGASLLEDGMERVLKYGILDEPTAAPDPKGEAKVYEMFYRLHFRMQAQKEANMVPAIPPLHGYNLYAPAKDIPIHAEYIFAVRKAFPFLFRRSEYILCIQFHMPCLGNIEHYTSECAVHINLSRAKTQKRLRKVYLCSTKCIFYINLTDDS